VLVGGLEVSQPPLQSKANLEMVFSERFPVARVILFDAMQQAISLDCRGWILQAAESLLQMLVREAGLHDVRVVPRSRLPVDAC
jgi:cell division inhibitor SulA